jgi:hypothetical protein
MQGVKVEITRWVDDHQPGIVECSLIDACGNRHLFIEKLPIVSSESLDAGSSYPRAGIIECRVTERRIHDGREVVVITTEMPWHIESTIGKSSFEVTPEQLVGSDC